MGEYKPHSGRGVALRPSGKTDNKEGFDSPLDPVPNQSICQSKVRSIDREAECVPDPTPLIAAGLNERIG
jgi:hypothetical protein